jgi:pyruvate kinase
MVARGDLAVELPPERVPILQKNIIEQCARAGKPVIVATQMLETMITNPVPTRAEVSDVANSIFDGADAIMLSAETAVGAYSVEVIETMSRVARAAEAGFPHWELLAREGAVFTAETHGKKGVTDSISHSVANTAHEVGASVIVALTETGTTARAVARYRPAQPIVVMSPNERTLGRAMLSFGSYPVAIRSFKFVGEAVDRIKKELIKHKFAKKGDRMVIAAGVPFGKRGGTNMVLVHTI